MEMISRDIIFHEIQEFLFDFEDHVNLLKALRIYRKNEGDEDPEKISLVHRWYYGESHFFQKNVYRNLEGNKMRIKYLRLPALIEYLPSRIFTTFFENVEVTDLLDTPISFESLQLLTKIKIFVPEEIWCFEKDIIECRKAKRMVIRANKNIITENLECSEVTIINTGFKWIYISLPKVKKIILVGNSFNIKHVIKQIVLRRPAKISDYY